MAKTYILLEDRLGLKAGTIVMQYVGHDYGLCRDDEFITRENHVAITAGPDSDSTPFFTCPEKLLKPVE